MDKTLLHIKPSAQGLMGVIFLKILSSVKVKHILKSIYILLGMSKNSLSGQSSLFLPQALPTLANIKNNPGRSM